MADELPDVADDEMPLPFGVRAGSGESLPGLANGALQTIGVDPQSIIQKADPKEVLAAAESVKDPNALNQAGWGVIFAAGTSPDVVAALKPLLDLRKGQAGPLYREFPDYPAGQSARDWLNKRGVTLAVVDPTQGVPLYLLIVGSPTEVSFEFQYLLDCYWNVGRLHFDTPAEYAAYAEAVVKYEQDAVSTTRTSAFWVTKNAADRATGLLHNQIGVPLAKGQGATPLGAGKGFAVADFLGEQATRANLEAILRGDVATGRPSLLFTGSHGVAFDSTKAADQREGQGALLSQAWAKGSPATPDQYLRGADVPADAKVQGMIHFLFACYGGGCPAKDTYSRGPDNKPVPLMDAPIVARLPQRLLARGALAVLAHIDRAWAFSFQTDRGGPQVQEFRSVMERLLAGERIGQATDDFNRRWSVLSSELQMLVEEQQVTGAVPAPNLANRWVARDDARNYLILGDPAVRLRVEAIA
ncbi:MAG TPA: hypothetical protein VL263_20340 [Vicinamibacterales bacterium]|nr:hypothetical protein [Vicinamibacterales bacterium]